LWDISNHNAITHQILAGHPSGVNAVAFSEGGDKIISGCFGNQNNLILWDISNPNAITHQLLAGHPIGVTTVALSADGNKIISGSQSNQNNLIVFLLLSTEEKKTLDNCTLTQAQFIYQITLASKRGSQIEIKSPFALAIYNSLPSNIQKLLQLRFKIKLTTEQQQGKCLNPLGCVIF